MTLFGYVLVKNRDLDDLKYSRDYYKQSYDQLWIEVKAHNHEERMERLRNNNLKISLKEALTDVEKYKKLYVNELQKRLKLAELVNSIENNEGDCNVQ